MGWKVEAGGVEGGLYIYHSLEQKSSHYVLIEAQKRAQCTCQAELLKQNMAKQSRIKSIVWHLRWLKEQLIYGQLDW